MTITLSDNAIHKMQKSLAERGKGIGIRLGVKTTGCSGYAYVLEYADKYDEADSVTDIDDFKIVIDAKSMPYLTGIHVDYVKQGLNEGFTFTNPNSKGECGCGESFTV